MPKSDTSKGMSADEIRARSARASRESDSLKTRYLKGKDGHVEIRSGKDSTGKAMNHIRIRTAEKDTSFFESPDAPYKEPHGRDDSYQGMADRHISDHESSRAPKKSARDRARNAFDELEGM